MGYSIFQDTMVDMTYPQVEEAARKHAPVLFPIGVTEEHGPHLCLGTDTYLAYNLCKLARRHLAGMGVDSLIAPPFYWGVCSATDGFAGSFTVKPETMISVLCDSLECLKRWGFDRIFLVNLHGDLQHNLILLETARRAYEEGGVGAYFLMPEAILGRAHISEIKPYMLVIRGGEILQSTQDYFDVHAGGFETSLMLHNFPELVDAEKAKVLASSRTTLEGLIRWERGGEDAREVTPLGYLGDPSNIDPVVAAFEKDMAATIAGLVAEQVHLPARRP